MFSESSCLSVEARGLIVDRKESGAPGDFASLQTEEEVSLWCELSSAMPQQRLWPLRCPAMSRPSRSSEWRATRASR
jgi:hypothetical protein